MSSTKRSFDEAGVPAALPVAPATEDGDNKKARVGGLDAPEDAYQEHSMKVVVPNTKVGSVIGKGGAMIRFIRETTKAQVNVSSAIPGETDRVVTITGTQEATQKAFNLIQAKVAEEDGAGGGGGGGGGGNNAPDNVQPGEIIVRQLIPAIQIGPLIGKRGATIGLIRSQSGAKVKISSDPEPGTNERTITIIGTLLQCQFAQQLISQKLLEDMNGTSGGYGGASAGAYGAGAYGAESSTAAAGAGGYGAAAGGASAYGASPYGAAPVDPANPYAAAPPADPSNPYAAAPGAGAYGAAAYGASPYGATADPYAAGAYGAAPPPTGMMGQYGMPEAQQAYQQQAYGAAPPTGGGAQTTTAEIQMPDAAMGLVIGRQGSNINEIRSVSGCQIKVVPKDGISPMRRVTLTGTAEQIASATLMIQRMT